MGDKNPDPSSGKTLRVTESATLPPMACTSPGRTSTTMSQWPGPRSRFSRVVPPPSRDAHSRSPTCGARSFRWRGIEGGARPAGALDHALDIDRVARVGTEQVARHAGALDVPGDEGRRPRHVVQPAEVGLADTLPVVADALGRVALLHARLLGACGSVGRIGRSSGGRSAPIPAPRAAPSRSWRWRSAAAPPASTPRRGRGRAASARRPALRRRRGRCGGRAGGDREAASAAATIRTAARLDY